MDLFFLGQPTKSRKLFNRLPEPPPIVILRLRNMTALDATGLQALETLADAIHQSGRGFLLCGAREQPARLMRQAEFEHHVGPGNICPSIADALDRAKELFLQLEQELASGGQHWKAIILTSSSISFVGVISQASLGTFAHDCRFTPFLGPAFPARPSQLQCLSDT